MVWKITDGDYLIRRAQLLYLGFIGSFRTVVSFVDFDLRQERREEESRKEEENISFITLLPKLKEISATWAYRRWSYNLRITKFKNVGVYTKG